MNIAVNKRVKDAQGNWGDQATFFNVTFWGKWADGIEKRCYKGQRLIVSGEMQEHRWEDQQGVKKSYWYILGHHLETIDWRENTSAANTQQPTQAQSPAHTAQENAQASSAAAASQASTAEEDDLPF